MSNIHAAGGRPVIHVDHYPALLDLTARSFLILGSGPGIGRETARALTQAGAQVLCVDRDEAIANAVAQEVGGEAIVANLVDPHDIEGVFAEADRRFGAQFSGFVDVAGLAIIKPLEALDDDDWAAVIAQNLGHAHRSVRHAARFLRPNGGGAICFVGSLAGILTFRNQIAYGAAKAALHQFVRGAANEFAPAGIRINAVAPGFVRSPALLSKLTPDFWASVDETIPLGRVADPADVASAILYHQSDLGRYITGQIAILDGGLATVPACPMI